MWNKKSDGSSRGWIKKIVAVILVVLVVCGIVALFLFPDTFNLDAMRRWVRYLNVRSNEEEGIFSFDSHNSNRYANYDDGLAVASVGGLNTYESDGREAVVSQGQLGLPAIQTGGDLVMAYDVGGTALFAVHHNSGEVLRITSEKAILDADISEGGDICYMSSAAGYKSVLTVYNDKQELVYRWLSSSTYMPLCTVSENGTQLASVGLDQKDGGFESTLNLFRTRYDQIEKTVSLGNELIYDLEYLGDRVLCAVGENSVQFLDTTGEAVGSYSYGDQFLKDYDMGGDGFLTLSLNMYRAGNRYTLVTVDETGQEIASSYLGQEILDLSACEKYIAVLTPDGLTVYNRLLEVYAETKEVGAATSVLMREDGSVLLLGAGMGNLYIP